MVNVKDYKKLFSFKYLYQFTRQLILHSIANLKSGFVKNVTQLLTGTVATQVIFIVTLPILARFYRPEDYAALALFIAISSFIGVIVGGRYEFSLMLPENNNEGMALMVLATMLACIASCIVGLFILLGNGLVDRFYGDILNASIVFLLPLGILCYTLNNIGEKWHVRTKQYVYISRVKIVQAVIRVCVQFSLMPLGGEGLVLGYLAGFIISVIFLYSKYFFDIVKLSRNHSKKYFFQLAKKYKHFPLYSVPSGIISQLAHQFPNFVLPMFGSAVLGNFSMANKILGTPLGFLGASLSNVFFQKISENRKDKIYTKKILLKAYVVLFLSIIGPMAVLFFMSEQIARLLLGPGWEEVGIFIKLMIPLQIMRFVVSPTSLSMQALEKQKPVLLWMVCYFLIVATSIIYGYFFFTAVQTILIFSCSSALMYGVWIFMSLELTTVKNN